MIVSEPQKSSGDFTKRKRSSALSNALEPLDVGFFVLVSEYDKTNIYSCVKQIANRLQRKFTIRKIDSRTFEIHRTE